MVDTNEIGTNEIGTNEIGTNEIGTNEIGTNEIGTNEIEDEKLDTEWIDDFKKKECMYNDFYKEPVTSISIFLLYIDKNNELEHLNTDKCLLSDDGSIKRDVIISFIKRYQHFISTNYKLLSLIKYNINLEPSDIYDFVNEDINISDKRFIQSEKYLNDIHFDESIHMFQDLNALFFIFYEEKSSKQSRSDMQMTKRVKLTSHHKTKRNNNDKIKKNLKIYKQIS